MTAKITGYELQHTEPFKIEVEHNSVPYKVKLKINLTNTNLSTATITSDKVYKLGKECISWEGTDSVLPKKVPKFVKQAADSGLLDIELNNVNNNFQIRITVKKPIQSQPLTGTNCILLVQSPADFKKLFLKDNSQARNVVLQKMVNFFTEISSFTNFDIQEIVDVLELLASEQQERIAKIIVENCHLQQIATTVKSLQRHEQENYRLFIERLLSGMVEIFLNKPVISQENLNQLMQLFEDLGSDDQACFINKLFKTNQLTSNNIITENATEALKILQRQGYRLASLRRGKDSNTQFSLISKLSKSNFLSLIKFQINILQNEINDPTAIYHLTCVNSLMEIAISSKIEPLKKEHFDSIYNALRIYKEKRWTTRWTKHKESRHPCFEVNFLTEFAIQMLKMIGSTESNAFTSVRHAFYFIKGVGELAAAIDVARPWGILKGAIDSGEWFVKSFSFKELKSNAFLSLSLLQNTYLGGDQNSLEDFENLAIELVDLKKEAANKKAFPHHHKSFFVLGLIELLHSMKQTYGSDSEIGKKAIQLLEFIRDNNNGTPKPKGEMPLFRVRPKEVKSPIREYILDKINTFFVTKSEAKVEESINTSNTSRVFLPAFTEQFFWVESMRLNLEKLKKDKQIIEDGPYVVELEGIGPKRETDLVTTLLGKALSTSQKLTLITGDPGSGKSLFLKNYVLSILENYQTNQPLPFYISLNLIREPNGKLIQEILEKYGLKEYESLLKKISTVWFFDSYDEIFLGNDLKPFNIFETNGLEDWPKAQFVFTCRKKLLAVGDDQQFFVSQGERVNLITISPFNDVQIGSFLKKYAEQNPHTALQTGDDYLNLIDRSNLRNLIRTPFYLRKVAEYLPTVLSDLEKNKKIETNNETFFLDLMISQIIKDLIKREADKTKSNPKGIRKPSEYLDFILKVSNLMQICDQRSISKDGNRSEVRVESLRIKKGVYYEERIKLRQEKKHSKNNNKTHDIKENILLITKKIKEINPQITLIKDKLRIEKKLSKYLFDPKYEYLRSSALFTLNTADEMEFSHIVLHDYLILMNKNQDMKNRLLDLFDPSKDSKIPAY